MTDSLPSNARLTCWQALLRRSLTASTCESVTMTAGSTLIIAGRPVDPARLAEVCRRYGVAELGVFGSAVRGEITETCDVDVLYELAPGTRLGFGINRLEDELSELFGRPVDLLAKKALHRLLRDDVTAQARTLYPA